MRGSSFAVMLEILHVCRPAFVIRMWLMVVLSFPLRDAYTQNLIAYYSGDAAQIDSYPVGELTHILFAFVHLKDGTLAVGSRRDSLTIRKLVSLKRRYPRLHILLSLGGWGGCKDCSTVFSDAAGRAKFIRSVVRLTDQYKTDGIDLDWEFPAFPAYPGHSYEPGDRGHFTQLLRGLRAALGPDKQISFIAAAFAPYLQGSFEWRAVMPLVDRVNLMTYDLIGSRSPITGHHAALYSGTVQKESADHAVRYLDSLGIPLSKIAIGVAFYGRLFDAVPDKNHGLYQPGRFRRFIPMRRIRTMFDSVHGYHSFWDDTARTPYKYNPTAGSFLTFDNERSAAAKAGYVKTKHLNGIMFWELRLDKAHGGLTDVLHDSLK